MKKAQEKKGGVVSSLGVILVKVSIAMMKHSDQKQAGKESVI